MKSDYKVSKLEIILIVGIIGCLLLASWEFMNLMTTEWLRDWVRQNNFTNKRIIYYGTAFTLSITSIVFTVKTIHKESRFISAINRAILWYGILLLISSIAVFVFDCLPEIFAGILGAGIFAYTIYLIQKKIFSPERLTSIRIKKRQCHSCGFSIQSMHNFCTNCGSNIKKQCNQCHKENYIYSSYCTHCGSSS